MCEWQAGNKGTLAELWWGEEGGLTVWSAMFTGIRPFRDQWIMWDKPISLSAVTQTSAKVHPLTTAMTLLPTTDLAPMTKRYQGESPSSIVCSLNFTLIRNCSIQFLGTPSQKSWSKWPLGPCQSGSMCLIVSFCCRLLTLRNPRSQWRLKFL